VGGVFLLLALFLVVVVKEFNEIVARYHTISAYCANPKIYASKFLLLTTTVVGTSLATAYVAAYNSTPEGTSVSTSQVVRFVLRLVAALVFPLVGIFPCEFNEPYCDFGACQIPSAVCSCIHLTAALIYFLGNAVLNLWDTIAMIHGPLSSPVIWSLFSLSVVSVILLASFVLVQTVIVLVQPANSEVMFETLRQYRDIRKRRSKWNQVTTEELQYRMEHQQEMKTRSRHIFSFLVELGVVVFVTVTSMLIALARNQCLRLLK
jgi:hypothetical protein